MINVLWVLAAFIVGAACGFWLCMLLVGFETVRDQEREQ